MQLEGDNTTSAKGQDIISEHYNATFVKDENKFGNSAFGLFFAGIFVWFLDSIQVILIAISIFIVFHIFIASPHTIEGPSMEPNFCEGDLVLADKVSPVFSGYEYGDVIIFRHDLANDYIKRVIGKPGDIIKIEDGSVFRNGVKLIESYLPDSRPTNIFTGSAMSEGADYKVPEGKLFVLGDNRERSVDSRSFLFIDPKINIIKGKISALIWPGKDARIFDRNQLKPKENCRN